MLANLTSSDFDIINDPNGWLDCSIIQQAQVLLQQQNPLIDGLQRPTLGQVRNFDIASGEFIQILHTGTDHWLCSSSIGCSPGVVHLFDSFYNDVILTDVEEQTQDLLGGKQVDLVFVFQGSNRPMAVTGVCLRLLLQHALHLVKILLI